MHAMPGLCTSSLYTDVPCLPQSQEDFSYADKLSCRASLSRACR